ncbi:MAG: M60 family metallopeptidase, partial [Clostridia bacterium]|nr:M60 family metallopeptidase [Clostridia bacterium]
GNMHEYHHNFQGYGVGGGGEVTNNAMTLVSYSLYTRISRARSVNNYGVSGLSGWNRFTSATWATKEVINKSWGGNGKNGLALYAALLHNFGQDAFISARKQANAQSYVGYYNGWTKATHNDMSYFFNDILGGGVSQDAINAANGNKNYPLFVPIASVYQTGRSYTYDGQKRYFDTMQPYVIKYGEPFTVDLNKYTGDGNVSQTGSVVIPDRFEYTINSITNNSNGTISDVDLAGKKFTFNPSSELFSGKILVNVSIRDTLGQYTNIDDVDLVLQFEQSHEMNKNVLQKDIYSYSERKYETAKDAYEANFAGASSSELKVDHANPKLNGKIVQNCNAEIWYLDMLKNDSANTGDGVAPEGTKSQVIVLNGKVYVNEDAKYRFSARGRKSVALYLSFDGGNNFEFACEYNGGNDANFPTAEGTYKDYELKSDTWVYFKLVLLRDSEKETRGSFIGLGWGKFVPAVYEKDAEGNLIMDESGNPIVKTPEKVSVGYASANRVTYEQNNAKFEPEYKYKRPYTYNYTNNVHLNPTQTVVEGEEFTNYVASTSYRWSDYPISNLIDGNRTTTIHTKDNGLGVSEAKKLLLTLDMGEEKTANRMVI